MSYLKEKAYWLKRQPGLRVGIAPLPSERFSQTPRAQTLVWHPARPGGARGPPGGGARAVDTWYPRHRRHYATRGDAYAEARSTLTGDHISEEKTATEKFRFPSPSNRLTGER